MNGKLFPGSGREYFWRERVANYFQDPVENDFGGKRVANYFLMRRNMISAGKNDVLFSGPGRT
jgi:hypothetical protein